MPGWVMAGEGVGGVGGWECGRGGRGVGSVGVSLLCWRIRSCAFWLFLLVSYSFFVIHPKQQQKKVVPKVKTLDPQRACVDTQ